VRASCVRACIACVSSRVRARRHIRAHVWGIRCQVTQGTCPLSGIDACAQAKELQHELEELQRKSIEQGALIAKLEDQLYRNDGARCESRMCAYGTFHL
jgi:hypothetical protein